MIASRRAFAAAPLLPPPPLPLLLVPILALLSSNCHCRSGAASTSGMSAAAGAGDEETRRLVAGFSNADGADSTASRRGGGGDGNGSGSGEGHAARKRAARRIVLAVVVVVVVAVMLTMGAMAAGGKRKETTEEESTEAHDMYKALAEDATPPQPPASSPATANTNEDEDVIEEPPPLTDTDPPDEIQGEEDDGDDTPYRVDATEPIRMPSESNALLTRDALDKSAADLAKRCPHWPPAVTRRFAEQCAPWLSAIRTWETTTDHRADRSGASVYRCADETSCNGLGDRVAGMQDALSYAVASNRSFRVQWSGLNRLFSTCVFANKAGRWDESPPPAHGCSVRSSLKCAWTTETSPDPLHSHCPMSTSLARVFNAPLHACLPKSLCPSLRKHFPVDTNAAQVFGCPLRAMLEPKDQLLDTKFPWQTGNSTKRQSLRDILADMSRFYVIAVHVRVGDRVMTSADVKNPTTLASFRQPFHCAETVMSYVTKRRVNVKAGVSAHDSAAVTRQQQQRDDDDQPQWTVNGRPVRFLVASDSETVRDMASAMYGSRVMRLNIAPQHIAMVARNAHDAALSSTFAEWLLLSAADSIVLNKIGKDLFHGRISAYPKSAWVYGLKHLYYDASNCRLRTLPLEGNWKGSSTVSACKSDATQNHLRFPQPHLHPLDATNVSFPKAFVRGERVVWSV